MAFRNRPRDGDAVGYWEDVMTFMGIIYFAWSRSCHLRHEVDSGYVLVLPIDVSVVQ